MLHQPGEVCLPVRRDSPTRFMSKGLHTGEYPSCLLIQERKPSRHGKTSAGGVDTYTPGVWQWGLTHGFFWCIHKLPERSLCHYFPKWAWQEVNRALKAKGNRTQWNKAERIADHGSVETQTPMDWSVLYTSCTMYCMLMYVDYHQEMCGVYDSLRKHCVCLHVYTEPFTIIGSLGKVEGCKIK